MHPFSCPAVLEVPPRVVLVCGPWPCLPLWGPRAGPGTGWGRDEQVKGVPSSEWVGLAGGKPWGCPTTLEDRRARKAETR